MALYSHTNLNTAQMSYFVEDHQGGVSTIASNSGAADVNESFSAFGQRRNPSTWSGAPSTSDLNTIAGLTRQGYTFQTWLAQSMGLNHMKGRVQDAILGKFLSPDPHIPDPTSAQSYNRYSYANNNPVTLTDPTGYAVVPYCQDWCPGANWHPAPYAFAGLGNYGGALELAGLTGTNMSEDEETDLQQLTAWFTAAENQQWGAINAGLSGGSIDGSLSDTGSGGLSYDNASSSNPALLAQSQGPTQSGQPIDMSPSADGFAPVVVTAASTSTSITYGAQQTGNFSCGSGTCYWQMGPYVNTQFSFPLRGATLQVKAPGSPNGSKWMQTYVGTGVNDTGQPVQDCSTACPFYSGYGTNGQYFYDASARYDSSANWFAMTTLVGPNGNPIVTFTWGFMLSSDGIALTLPQVVP